MRKHVKTVVDKKGESKVNEVTAVAPTMTEVNINLCDGEGFRVTEEFLINYTYLERQVIVLDIGAPLSLAGFKWLEQILVSLS